MRTIGRGRLLASLLALALLLCAPASNASGGEGLDELWADLKKGSIQRLHKLARLYSSAKLFGTRTEVYELILTIDPDDAVARKWCKYKKTDEGWVRPERYKRPKNRGPLRADIERKREAVATWLGDEAAALAADAMGRRRFRLYGEILDFAIPLAPEHVMLRSVNGEVKMNPGCGLPWVLKETWAATKRRTALRDVASRAVAKPPKPKPGSRSEGEALDTVPEGIVLQGPHIRVLGPTPEPELKAHYGRLEAAWPTFKTALGIDPPSWTSDMKHGEGLSVYVFEKQDAAKAWLDALPDLTEEQRTFGARLAAYKIPGRPAVMVTSFEQGLRLEAGVKMVLDSMVITRLGITGRRAWISEGLNHYLAYPITGTRLVGTVGQFADRYAPQVAVPETPLPSTLPGDSWLAAGLAVLESEAKPDFYLMVGKRLGQLTGAEVLYSYCIAAWLVEGRPDDCIPFLKGIGATDEVDLDTLLIEHLGLDGSTLERRVRRWLKETTALSAPQVK